MENMMKLHFSHNSCFTPKIDVFDSPWAIPWPSQAYRTFLRRMLCPTPQECVPVLSEKIKVSKEKPWFSMFRNLHR